MAIQTEERPQCPKCGSKTGFVRIKTSEFVCQKCGTVSKINKPQ